MNTVYKMSKYGVFLFCIFLNLDLFSPIMGKYKTTNIRIDVFFSIRINLNVLMYNISKVPTFQNVFFFTLIIEFALCNTRQY